MSTGRLSRGRRRILLIALGGLAVIAVLLIAPLTKGGSQKPDARPQSTASDVLSHNAADPDAVDSPTAHDAAQSQVPDMSRREADDVTALGDINAPVVIVEYADYRCPYCGVFGSQTLPAIIEEYVEPGHVRVEWRDIPLFGEDSFNAAVAARAAGAQGLFWDYQHAVYAHQDGERKDLPREQLVAIARDSGVPDIAAFEAGLDDPALHDAVVTDALEAQSIRVQSTPSFLIGGTPLMGAQPIEVFRQVIDLELTAAGE